MWNAADTADEVLAMTCCAGLNTLTMALGISVITVKPNLSAVAAATRLTGLVTVCSCRLFVKGIPNWWHCLVGKTDRSCESLWLQVWNAEDTEDEVLAMVCRTGLNTQVGSMVRELVAPSKQAAESDTFVKVS